MTESEFDDPKALCRFIDRTYKGSYIHAKRLPEPFYVNLGQVKAIVLGTDPSNPAGRFFEKVFGLEDLESPYFRSIKNNLRLVGLSLDDIYVQNLCRNYSPTVTSENPDWRKIAPLWLRLLQRELDEQFPRSIPVLFTAWDIYRVLAVGPIRVKPSYFYQSGAVISPTENCLGRVMIPFFRHYSYRLEQWSKYNDTVRRILIQKKKRLTRARN